MASTLRSLLGGSSMGDDRSMARASNSLAAFQVEDDPGLAQSLSLLIEGEVIPRLIVAHACDAAPAVRGDGLTDAADIEAFASLAIQVEADELLGHVEALLARGIGFDSLMVDLFAPTAQALGRDWEEDRADFIDVTMGLWRLQEVIHQIADRVPVGGRQAGRPRALFAAMPGDQHSFGTVVIDELFRRDGWSSERLCDGDPAELRQRVATEWLDLVGLTVSCDCHIARLPSLIAVLRNISRNPQLCVMVGGRIFTANPALAVEVGADGTAHDARAALAIARGLVRQREGEAAAYH